MTSDNNVNPETLEAQIVVIGGGGAGLAAAVAAAEKGADVILLEKAGKPGGNTQMAREIFGAESPLQKRLNINVPRDEYFKIHMDFCHWAVNPRLVRAFIDKSGDTIRWLEEKGVIFDIPEGRFVRFKHQLPASSHIVRGDGIELIRVLARTFEGLGGRLLCGTRAKDLLTGDKKQVTGVLAARRKGELSFKASSVIIASGGFGGNKKLLKKYCPDYRENMQLRGFPNMGDGLLMAMKAGAATEGLGMLQLEAKGFPRGMPEQLWNFSTQRNVLWVNKKGERFIDEGVDNVFEAANAVLRQPDNISYNLFDEPLRQKIEKLRVERGGTLGGPLMKLPPGERIVGSRQLLQSAVDMGTAKISDSWDEIATWMGAAPEVLKATVDEYNSLCDKGHDSNFAKDARYLVALRTPPYYAIRCIMRLLATMGGIKINHHMEVLDREDKPIPGLYAAGIDAGGWETATYDQLLTGSALSFPLNSGRIAGENAVKYVRGK
jgi:fumarate reductase flavoprotein subunit